MRGYVVLGGLRTAWRGFTADGTDAAYGDTDIHGLGKVSV